MDSLPFADAEAMQAWMQSETNLEVNDDAVAAAIHSIYCVLRRQMAAAGQAVKQQVAEAVAAGSFDGLPPLQARHFRTRFE